MNNIIEKDKVSSKINLTNSNEYPDDDFDIYEFIKLKQRYGLCPGCKQPNTDKNWCKECNSKRFKQNFNNWTSGNEHVDKFIQESQLKARNRYELLEWIPYTKLRNIQFLAQGGFSTICKGIWLDGHLNYWDYEKQDWKREVYKRKQEEYKYTNNFTIKNPLKSNEEYGYPIVLKFLNDSSNINDNFLNEVTNY
jgi:hypothetical protein